MFSTAPYENPFPADQVSKKCPDGLSINCTSEPSCQMKNVDRPKPFLASTAVKKEVFSRFEYVPDEYDNRANLERV